MTMSGMLEPSVVMRCESKDENTSEEMQLRQLPVMIRSRVILLGDGT